MTQKEAVLAYMRDNGAITSRDAFAELGVSRLAAVISQIKKDGVEVESENKRVKTRYGETTVSRYSLI